MCKLQTYTKEHHLFYMEPHITKDIRLAMWERWREKNEIEEERVMTEWWFKPSGVWLSQVPAFEVPSTPGNCQLLIIFIPLLSVPWVTPTIPYFLYDNGQWFNNRILVRHKICGFRSREIKSKMPARGLGVKREKVVNSSWLINGLTAAEPIFLVNNI